jgi:hypothetical protein
MYTDILTPQQTVCLYELTIADNPKLQICDIKQNTAKI